MGLHIQNNGTRVVFLQNKTGLQHKSHVEVQVHENVQNRMMFVHTTIINVTIILSNGHLIHNLLRAQSKSHIIGKIPWSACSCTSMQSLYSLRPTRSFKSNEKGVCSSLFEHKSPIKSSTTYSLRKCSLRSRSLSQKAWHSLQHFSWNRLQVFVSIRLLWDFWCCHFGKKLKFWLQFDFARLGHRTLRFHDPYQMIEQLI